MASLEERIRKIEERNQRVELDKAWEVSWTRRIIVAIFTYLTLGLYLRAINVGRPWQNAIVPTIGFLLSTLTLPWFRKIWEKVIKSNRG